MCPCSANEICSYHRAEIHRQLDRVDQIRRNRGTDTVEVDRVLAFLRIDYGTARIDAVVAERAAVA